MAEANARSARAALAGAALLPLAYQLLFFDRWFSAMDEGHVLLFADIVARGGELYRDATLYPLPGAFYALAALFRVFEPSILLGRWVVVLEFCALGAVTAALLLRLAPGARAAPWRWASASAVLLFLYRVWAFPHWQMYGYSSLAILLLAVALLLFARFLDAAEAGNAGRARARRRLAAAGLAAGLAVFTKQDYGAAGLLALSLGLLAHARAARLTPRATVGLYGWLLVPPLLVGVATALHFARQGLLLEMARQTVWNHLVGIGAFDYSTLPAPLPLFAQDPALRDSRGSFIYIPAIIYTADLAGLKASWLFRATAIPDVLIKAFFYAPYAFVALGAARLWRRRARADAAHATELTLFALAAALLLGFTLSRPHDWVHAAVLYWPWLPLLAVYARSLHARLRGRRAAWGATAALVGVLAPLLGYSGFLVWRLRAEHDRPVASERAGVRVRPSEARLLDEVVGHVRARSRPDERVAVLPYFPVISFLADRRGPHRSGYIVWPVPEIPDRDRAVAAALARERTALVIYSFTQFSQFPPVEDYAPELFAYLVDRYEIERVFSYDVWGYMLGALRPREAAPRGRPLLSPDGSEAVVWTRDPGAQPRALRGAERDEQFRVEPWPFRRVAALRPRAGGSRSTFAVSVQVPPGARLRTAVAVNPRHWFMYPASAVEFELGVRSGAGVEILLRRRLDPHRVYADRRWHELELPLDAYAGRRIQLEFSTSCERAEAELPHMAGWALPRLLGAAESGRGPRLRDGEEAVLEPGEARERKQPG